VSELSDELQKLPATIAGSVARGRPYVDREDLVQEAWVWLLHPGRATDYAERYGDSAVAYLGRNMKSHLLKRAGVERKRAEREVSYEMEVEAGRL
jgi:DNA-directed RNA polymerase specialized sigma24 family protein